MSKVSLDHQLHIKSYSKIESQSSCALCGRADSRSKECRDYV